MTIDVTNDDGASLADEQVRAIFEAARTSSSSQQQGQRDPRPTEQLISDLSVEVLLSCVSRVFAPFSILKLC